jgi:hypothetical protein
MSKKEKEFIDYERIDITYINKPLMLFRNVPAYVLYFLIIPIIGVFSFNLYIFIFSIILFIFLFKLSIFLTKKNISFFYFFSMIGYIFKPKYIIIRNKDYYKKRKDK